jgi:virulence-associated protein VapD
MFAIAFDLSVDDANEHHPKSSRQAYLDIEKTVGRFGFRRIQWSVYAAETDDMKGLVQAVIALKALPWLGKCARSVRAFRMERGTDFTSIFSDDLGL